MRTPTAVYIMFALGITLDLSVPGAVSAQVPSVERQPRAAVPVREGTIQTTAPAEPAPVTAAPPPSGVTQVPPAAAPPATASSSSAATAKHAYGTARFSLNLEGINAGQVQVVEGGAAVGNVVVNNGPDNIQKKHVDGVRYENLSFQVGAESKPVIEWVTAAWQGKTLRKSGMVQVLDQNYTVLKERQFTNAIITGTTVSALDHTTGKGALVFTVTVAPESVREVAGSGSSGKAQTPASKAKSLMSSNFRFEMGDLETAFVYRIEPFTVGQKVIEDQVGVERISVKQPNTLEFPNLKIRMSDRPSPNWAKWQEEFLIKGNGGEAQEKNGAIVFLDQTLTKELGRINLFNCGLIRLGGDRQEAMKGPGTVTADLYCERMELDIKA